MHLAICIVGFRNFDDIVRCMRALSLSTYSDFEVAICENGGEVAFTRLQDQLLSAVSMVQSVRIVQAPGNPGYAAGVNICMRETPSADAWWVLNPDTVVSPEALRHLVDRLALGDSELIACTVHYASGRVESRGGHWNAWLARAVSLDYGQDCASPARVSDLERRVNYASGAAMLVSRQFLERVGPMREEYFLYAEEVEWCLRGVALGMKIGVAVDAQVLHFQGASTGSVTDVSRRARMPVYLDERNKMLLTRDLFPRRLPVAALAAFLLLLLRFARRRAWRQLGYGLQGWFAGLRNERGKPVWVAD